MGMAEWEWVGMKTPHYPIYLSQVADHQTQLMDPSFCIVICRRLQTAMVDFTLHVHETLLALTLHVQAYIEDLSVVCIVEFIGHLLSDRDTTSSTGIGAGVNGNNQWEWEGIGLKKIFPLISSKQVFRRLQLAGSLTNI